MANAEIITCTYEELDTLLASLDANTANTAYKLNITDIPLGFSFNMATKLRSRIDVFLDLSKTTLPEVEGLSYCFEQCKNLVASPVLPDSATDMHNCFYNCESLTVIPNLPNSVTNMYKCFNGCKSLTVIPNMPNSVTSMYNCFTGCESLTVIPNIPNSVTSMDGCFTGCKSLTVIPNMPNSVTSMNSCFAGCKSLTVIPNIPNSVTSMNSCFSGCDSLTSVPSLPDSVTNMRFCFNDCISLTSVPNIPDFVTDMSYCFNECTSLTSVPNIPNSVTNMNSCFDSCTLLTSVPSLPDSVTDIGYCFRSCKSLMEISVFVNPLTKYTDAIENSAITTVYTEDKLKAETIFGTDVIYQGLCNYNGLETLLAERESNTVNNPLKIKIVDIPEDFVPTMATKLNTRTDIYVDLSQTILPEVTNLQKCFNGCTTLTDSPVFPGSVTNMCCCFNGCISLTSVPNLPDSVTDMERCFYSCKKLTNVPNIPDSVTNMNSCFSGCTSLTSVSNIPDSVTDMASCFEGCELLEFFPNMPISVINITSCFEGCTSLTTIENWQIEDLDKVAHTDAFKGCSSLENIYVTHTPSEPLDSYALFHIEKTNDVNKVSVIKNGQLTTNTFDGEFSNISVKGVIDEFAIGEQGSIPFSIAQKVDELKLPLSSLDKDFSPDDPHMVLWAKDKEKIKSNLLDGKQDKDSSRVNIYGKTYDTVSYGDDNPCIEFAETNHGSPQQQIRLSYTSYDTVQKPASLTLNGAQGGEFFIAPNIKATEGFYDKNGNQINFNGDGHIYFRSFRGTDVKNTTTLTNLVNTFPDGSLIIFWTDWYDYQNTGQFAGGMGYIIKATGSARAVGFYRRYDSTAFTLGVHWVDYVTADRCSGWYAL